MVGIITNLQFQDFLCFCFLSLIYYYQVISSMKAEMEEPEFSDNNYLFLLEDEEEKAK